MSRSVPAVVLLALLLFSRAPAFAQPPVAAYGLDEGSGATASDAAILGATWTSGRFGSALAFNGADARVIAPAVSLGPAFTLMAWVYSPAPRTYATIVTIGSDRDLYLGDGVVRFWDGATEYAFGLPLSTDAWHHVALVSDGARLDSYVDGARAGSAGGAALTGTSGALQIGAWVLGEGGADFFYGTIDEVRVYDRALSQAEIQRDMDAPVSAGPADTTPPSVVLTAPADGAVTAGTIMVAAEAGDDTGVVAVQILLDGAPLGAEMTSTPFSVPWDTRGVGNGVHTLTARARDASGNETTSAPISVTVDNATTGGYALRFHGNGVDDIDRVKIPIDAPARPADVGATDFTLEFWMKALAAENDSPSCTPGDDAWIVGNVIVDRDVTYAGDFGDFGISLSGGAIAFGVNVAGTGTGLCSRTLIADGVWHHVAVTRARGTGQIRIFIDGVLDAQGAGPLGDLSYRNNRVTNFPTDSYLVIGAEKADAGPAYPSYSGWIDEVRLSTILRYTSSFTRPAAPFVPDASTAALYHLDEGRGDVIADTSGAVGGPSDGIRKFGGSPAGPQWVTDTPFR